MDDRQFNAVQKIYDLYYNEFPDGEAFPIAEWADLPFSNKMKNREEGYIGELLLSKDTELERTCLIVSQVVKKDAFSLEEALDIYQVPFEKYTEFLAGTIVSDLKLEFGGMTASFTTKSLSMNLRAPGEPHSPYGM